MEVYFNLCKGMGLFSSDLAILGFATIIKQFNVVMLYGSRKKALKYFYHALYFFIVMLYDHCFSFSIYRVFTDKIIQIFLSLQKIFIPKPVFFNNPSPIQI